MSGNLIKLAIVAVVAMLLGATAGYVIGVSFHPTVTSYVTTTAGWTSIWFYAGCSGCLQAGAEPPVPSYVISVDGVPIKHWSGESFRFAVGSTHTILASNYTGTCSGIPCDGQNITVHFKSWNECIDYPSNGAASTCSVLNTADAHRNPLIITVPSVPYVGENGTVSILGDYAICGDC